jgi:hypothetical protein
MKVGSSRWMVLPFSLPRVAKRERRDWYICEGSMQTRQSLAVEGRELRMTEMELSIKLGHLVLVVGKKARI